MNGGFALKVAAPRAAVIAALETAAVAEGGALVALADDAPATDAPLRIGVGERAGETILLLADRGVDAPLIGIGEALSRRLAAPITVVVDGDEGAEHVRSWHGGEALAETAGWAQWTTRGYSRVALTVPPARALSVAERAPIVEALAAAWPARAHARGARVAAVHSRVEQGPIARGLGDWTVTVHVDGSPEVRVWIPAPTERDFAPRAAWLALAAVENVAPALPAIPAPPAVIDALAAGVPGVLTDEITQSGLVNVELSVRVSVDGVPSALTADVACDGGELTVAAAIGAVRAAVTAERGERAADRASALDDALDAQLRAGDLVAAAATYRERHFGGRADPASTAAADAKVADLARLYRRR